MLRHFFKDVGIYGISGLLVKAITLFLIPFYVRVLSPADYGIIDLVTAISSFVSVILSMEIYQSIARYFADINEKERQLYISTGFWFYLATYSIFLFFFIFNAKTISILVFNVHGKEKVFIIAIISIFVNALFSYFQVILRYSLQSVKYSIANILFSLSTLVFTVVFVLYFKHGLEGVYYGQIIGGIIGLIPAIYFNKKFLSVTIVPSALRKMLQFSLPLVPSGLAVFVLTYTDRLFIQRLLSLHELGVYGIAFRIASILAIFLGLINASFVPVIYKNYKNEKAVYEIKNIYHLTYFLLFVIITFISIFSKEILHLIATPEYYGAYKLIPFLLLAGFFTQYSNLFLGLSIATKTKAIAIINFLGSIMGVVLNFSLIPLLGLMGAAISATTVAIIVFLIQFAYSQKYYYIPIQYKPFIICFFISCFFILAANSFTAPSVNLTYIIKSLFFISYLFVNIKFSQIIKIQQFIKNKQWS